MVYIFITKILISSASLNIEPQGVLLNRVSQHLYSVYPWEPLAPAGHVQLFIYSIF